MIGLAKDDDDIRTEALLQRGVLYEAAGDREAAIRDYSEVIKIDPTSAVAYFNRGNVHDQMGEHERAIADYTEAIKLDPTDADVFNNRGQSYDAKGEPDLAIADYSQSIRLNRDNPRAFFNRGLAYANKDRVSARRRRFRRGDQARSARRGGLREPRRGARGAGQHAAARADYRKALEIVPDHDDAKEALARLGNN